MKLWPIIEWDQNLYPKIYDVVTPDYAKEFTIGEEMLVVCMDYCDRLLDWGAGFIAICTAIEEGELGWIVRGERKDFGPTQNKENPVEDKNDTGI
jgi:hypothetical protein